MIFLCCDTVELGSKLKKEILSQHKSIMSHENHLTVEELRKRKRGADETKTKKLISERAAALMEESLKNRGFKNIISPFAEMVEKRE